jgi:hypothetical protein
MAEFNELVSTLTWLLTNRIQQKIEYTHGLLGDGDGKVRVSADPGSPDVDFVFVRPDRNSNRTYKIFNKRVQGEDNDPIIIGKLPWEPNLFQVIDIDWATYKNIGWGEYAPNVTYHGKAHEWRDGAPGLDTFNVYRRQLGDLKAVPSTSGTSSVDISSYSMELLGTQKQFSGIVGFPLDGAIPAGSGTSRMALIYWDPSSGTTGALGISSGTLGIDTDATLLNRPVSPAGTVPIAHVRLAGGMSSIETTDIFDAREPFRPGIFFGTGSAGLSADKIPISDISGLYTGSTVEAALDEIGFDGARVSKVYESDFGAVALSSDASGQITAGSSSLNGVPLTLNRDTTANTILTLQQNDTALGTLGSISTVNLGMVFFGESLNDKSAYILIGESADVGGGSADNAIVQIRANKATSQPLVNNDYLFSFHDGGATDDIMMIKRGPKFGFGVTDPVALVHADQASTTAAIPVLKLDQGDISEQCIKFSSDAADRDINLYDVEVTGTPTYLWDESEDAFSQNKGLRVTSGEVVIGATTPLISAKLHVKVATDQNVLFTDASGETRINSINDAVSAFVTLGIVGDPIIFRGAGGAESARIDATAFDLATAYMELDEITAPGGGAANTARLYAVDNGAGKTQLVVVFSTGAAQVLATQP